VGRIDVGDALEAKLGQLGIGALVAVERGLEAIEGTVELTEGLASRPLAAGLRSRLAIVSPPGRARGRRPAARSPIVRVGLARSLSPPADLGRPRRAHELLDGVSQLLLARGLLEEVVGSDVEDVGEVAQVAAEAPIQDHRDRGPRPGPPQPGQEHVGIEIGDARDDQCRR
jgi:hypothetical protein